MMDLEFLCTRVSSNIETYIFYIFTLQKKFQRDDIKTSGCLSIRPFHYLAPKNEKILNYQNVACPSGLDKCLTRTDTNVYLWTPSRIQNTEKAWIPWNISLLSTLDFNDSSKLHIPKVYRNLQFDFKYLICVAVCVQIMQIDRIGVPWEAEVLWSKFHPKHPPYIWKSMRKSWRKCYEKKNFSLGSRGSLVWMSSSPVFSSLIWKSMR